MSVDISSSVPELAAVFSESSDSERDPVLPDRVPGSLAEPLKPAPAPARTTAPLAPAFQPRPTAFSAQHNAQAFANAAGRVMPNRLGAPIPIRQTQNANNGNFRTQPRTVSNNRHVRSISMPDAVLVSNRPSARSPTAQYNEAWDNVAQKYLRTPQLNNLNATLASNSDDALTPPSSPESVLFVEPHVHIAGLPKNFMRRRGNSFAANGVKTFGFHGVDINEDEIHVDHEDGGSCSVQSSLTLTCVGTGWTSFNSPPRPIPALHGPASLPYARCPSYVFSFLESSCRR